jgi:Fe-S cluster biosynthesis and repair protein YggX
MTRVVQCVVLKQELEGLENPPYPGELGIRIYENISKEAWKRWLEHLVMVINENGLNTADPRSLQMIEAHMMGYLFDEGQFSGAQKFRPPARK